MQGFNPMFQHQHRLVLNILVLLLLHHYIIVKYPNLWRLTWVDALIW
jgi:hypothetical protein